jgi:hypothetical protein
MMGLEIVGSRRDTDGSSDIGDHYNRPCRSPRLSSHPIPSGPARRKELQASHRKLELKSRLQM